MSFLIQDNITEIEPKIYIKKYWRENYDTAENITEVTSRVVSNETFCNNGSDSEILHIDEKIYTESYKSGWYFDTDAYIEYDANISVSILPEPSLSLISDSYINYTRIKEFQNRMKSVWTRVRPSQKVSVPVNSGKILA